MSNYVNKVIDTSLSEYSIYPSDGFQVDNGTINSLITTDVSASNVNATNIASKKVMSMSGLTIGAINEGAGTGVALRFNGQTIYWQDSEDSGNTFTDTDDIRTFKYRSGSGSYSGAGNLYLIGAETQNADGVETKSVNSVYMDSTGALTVPKLNCGVISNSGYKVFIQESEPTGMVNGDIWIQVGPQS